MTKQVWLPIFGDATVGDGTITHVPEKAILARASTSTADAGISQPPHTVLRSNIEFDQGIVTFEAKLGDPDCKVQMMLPAEPTAADSSEQNKGDNSGGDLSAGLNVCGTPYGFAFWRGSWEGAGGSGHGSTLPVNQWISIQVSAKGSTVDLYVSGVKVVSTTRTLRHGQLGLLLQGNSECAVRNVNVVQDAPECFVIMQFSGEFDALYKEVIRPICESYGYIVSRADDFCSPGVIMEDVTRSIRSAALIIADVTMDNSNVFYEVGFAHAIAKPTILLSDKKRERLPFDISGFRTLFYDNTIGGKSVVEERLKQFLNVLRPR